MMELFTGAALSAAEAAINRVIALDPAAGARLKALDGTRVLIESTMPTMHVSIRVHEHGLLLGSATLGDADAVVRGPAPALLELLLSRSGKLSLHGKEVKVRGDLEKVQRLQQLLHDLRIDWEYPLSKLIGDVPTQGFADFLRGGMDTLRKGTGSLRMDLDDYLHEERRVLPGRQEVEAFYSQLHQLRLDLDRLSARLDRAASRLTKGPQEPPPPPPGAPAI